MSNVMIFEAVGPDMDRLIKVGLATCWPQLADRFFKEGRILNGNFPLYTLVILNERAEKVIAHCGLVAKEISCSKTPYEVAGLQQTFVIPEYRGTGLTRILLDTFMQLSHLHKFDFAVGFARTGICEFHRKAGWSVSDVMLSIYYHMVWKGVCQPTEVLLPDCTNIGGAIW